MNNLPHYTDEFIREYRTSGVVKPSGFAEYDELTGYVVGEYAYEWQDRGGARYRTTCTVVNLGRPDRGIPADPEGQMAQTGQDETLFRRWVRRAEWTSREQQVANKHTEALRLLGDLLRERGPLTLQQIHEASKIPRSWVYKHLAGREHTVYCRVGQLSKVRWGLIGVHDAGT